MLSRKFLHRFCILQILSLRNLKISSESKRTETSKPFLLKELKDPKNRPILKAEKKWSIPSWFFHHCKERSLIRLNMLFLIP